MLDARLPRNFRALLPLVVALLAIGLGYRAQQSNKLGTEHITNGTLPFAETSAVVARVVDGDTVKLENGATVRYIGMDTPETVDPRKSVQCFGKEAKTKNTELVEGKIARLVPDVENTDHYGRYLRYVYVDDIFVNLELVKQGYAYSYPYPPNITYEAEFRAAQTEARLASRGLWGGCGENEIAPHLERSK